MMNLVTLDFETFYGDGYTLSLREMTTEKYICDGRFKAHGVGIKIGGAPSYWVGHDNIADELAKIDWNNTALIGHNLQFDGAILAWHYDVYPKLYIDTLALSRALVGPHSPRHGLKYIAQLLCGMTKMDELSKSYNIRDLSPELEARIADYCTGLPRVENGQCYAGDTELTWAIFSKMISHFPVKELKSLDWTIRAFTMARLELDQYMLAKYLVKLRAQKATALKNAGLESRDILMSNPKFAEALESLGITPPTKVNKAGKVTLAFAKTDPGLKQLLEHDNPDVQALVAARLEHKSTIEETRTQAYLEAAKFGPWPVAYNYAGATVTQRFSGNKGSGGNPQNLKRGGVLRMAICAPENCVLGVGDLSQIEARIVLWLGMQITGPDGDEAEALRVMQGGGDIYAWFGSRIYGVKITKQTHPLERQISKSAVLGLGYGMGVGHFLDYCKQMGIEGVTPELGEFIVKLYRNTFRGVRRFWSECQNTIKRLSSVDGPLSDAIRLPFEGNALAHVQHDPLFNDWGVKLPSGLFIKYPKLEYDPEGEITYQDGNARRKLFGGMITENIVQAVAAQVMRDQLVEMNKIYPVVMTTHDELCSIVPYGDEEKYIHTAKEIMTRPVEYLPGLPLGTDVHTGRRYGEAK